MSFELWALYAMWYTMTRIPVCVSEFDNPNLSTWVAMWPVIGDIIVIIRFFIYCFD